MKFLLAALILCVLFVSAQARPVVEMLSKQELFDKADLVVIARPTSTKDTSEKRNLPGMEHVPVIGVETELTVSAVLKGKRKTIKNFVLHHYRWNPSGVDAVIVDGPALLHFDPKDEYNGDYLLFLVRESDGRYAPASGQVDPAIISVFDLWQANHWEDVKALREEQRTRKE